MMASPFTWLAFASSALALPPLGYDRKLLHEALGKRGYNTTTSCLTDAAPITTAPRSNVWAQISAADNLAVWDLLHHPETGLNLTDPADAVPSDNYV
jgi:primary-amine oxidase